MTNVLLKQMIQLGDLRHLHLLSGSQHDQSPSHFNGVGSFASNLHKFVALFRRKSRTKMHMMITTWDDHSTTNWAFLPIYPTMFSEGALGGPWGRSIGGEESRCVRCAGSWWWTAQASNLAGVSSWSALRRPRTALRRLLGYRQSKCLVSGDKGTEG